MNNRDGTPMLQPVRHVLATDKVRHVGEPVACVVAESAAAAKDAAEAVIVDIEPLPAVTEPRRPTPRCAADSTTTFPAMSGSTSTSATVRRSTPPSPRRRMYAARRCATTASSSTRWSRAPRIAEYDAERGHWTLYVGCQGVFGFRNYIAQACSASGATRCGW